MEQSLLMWPWQWSSDELVKSRGKPSLRQEDVKPDWGLFLCVSKWLRAEKVRTENKDCSWELMSSVTDCVCVEEVIRR